MKQSAVEWLSNEFYEKLEVKGDGALFNDLVNQAKEMEKQQIIDSYANGHNNGCLYMNNEKQIFEHAEQYYNKTFKNK